MIPEIQTQLKQIATLNKNDYLKINMFIIKE